MVSQSIKTQKSNPEKPVSEFYGIPLLGEVHIEGDGGYHGDYNIGEIITNIAQKIQKTISLQAADNALENAGIYKDDFLTVSQNEKLKNGDIAVVKLGYRIYIRKIFFKQKHILLETATLQPNPLIISIDTPGFEIIGKVVTVIREL